MIAFLQPSLQCYGEEVSDEESSHTHHTGEAKALSVQRQPIQCVVPPLVGGTTVGIVQVSWAEELE